jgi:hypothetical protein
MKRQIIQAKVDAIAQLISECGFTKEELDRNDLDAIIDRINERLNDIIHLRDMKLFEPLIPTTCDNCYSVVDERSMKIISDTRLTDERLLGSDYFVCQDCFLELTDVELVESLTGIDEDALAKARRETECKS